MKALHRRRAAALAAAAALLWASAAAGCSGSKAAAPALAPASSQEELSQEELAEMARSLYLQEVNGLHVTGVPVVVDLASYRLKVTGEVRSPLSLSFDQLRSMPSVREHAVLECPGFFVDEGSWRGVRVRELLRRAGVEEGATRVVFTSADGRYSAELPLSAVMEEGFLVAFAFEGRQLLPIHGFPLRLVARGFPGNRWVKWLGELSVR